MRCKEIKFNLEDYGQILYATSFHSKIGEIWQAKTVKSLS
jgi:hypothetical protein